MINRTISVTKNLRKDRVKMGLAASQARFLAITSRKADCEFRSMEIAQEKLSLTRELSRATDKYEEALDATKLVWDGETEDGTVYDLSYDVMMSPSELNGYSPFLVTNRTGQIVLSEQLAKAAEVAGIDSISSSGSLDGRNKFALALAQVGYISGTTAEAITGVDPSYWDPSQPATGSETIEWSDKAGFGGQMLDKSVANAMTITTMASYFENILDPDFRAQLPAGSDQKAKYDALAEAMTFKNDGTFGDVYVNGSKSSEDFTILDLLTDNVTLSLDGINNEEFQNKLKELVKGRTATADTIDGANGAMSALAVIAKFFEQILPKDVQTEETNAFEFAINETIQQLADYSKSYGNFTTSTDKVLAEANGTNGAVYNSRVGLCVSASNMIEMFLTNYAFALGGYESGYFVTEKTNDSNYVTNDYNYMYVLKNQESVYEEKDLMIADFINVLYNNICSHGWTRSTGDIEDNEFLQNALKNGQYFISSLNSDMYYYQDHYTKNGCVGEVTDSDAVTQAEAEYTKTKNKINYKEEMLEIELKNLDLEISSLTTEYDTVKSMISKNVEKVFTMFNS